MTPHEPRYPLSALAPLPRACEQRTRLVYEPPDAHDDTARIATGQDLDPRWQAPLGYLRDPQRVARELRAHAGSPACAPADPPTREAGMFWHFGPLSNRIPRDVVDRAARAPISKRRSSMKHRTIVACAPAAATRPLASEEFESAAGGNVNRSSRQGTISRSGRA
jgi:hypothetical protein